MTALWPAELATAAGGEPAQRAFRAQFPLLADGTVHLASCSLAPTSAPLEAAMARALRSLSTDVLPWEIWMAEVEEARGRFARLIGAAPEDVAVVPSATVGAFQAVSTVDWSRRPGLVATRLDYSSLSQTWLAQRVRGAEPRFVRESGGLVDPDAYVESIDDRTAFVSVPLLSYASGARLPMREAVARAREVGARTFVDAYQGAGVVPIDVDDLGCDYLVSGTMKYLLGITGIAFLYARPGLVDDIPPQLTGFYGRANPIAFDPEMLDFPDDARRFQIGMPPYPSALAANAGLAMVGALDPRVVERHVDGLVQRTIDRLADIGARIDSPTSPELRGPQVAIAVDDPVALAAFLRERHVHAARGHVVRFSFHYFNDEHDVDVACDAVADYLARR